MGLFQAPQRDSGPLYFVWAYLGCLVGYVNPVHCEFNDTSDKIRRTATPCALSLPPTLYLQMGVAFLEPHEKYHLYSFQNEGIAYHCIVTAFLSFCWRAWDWQERGVRKYKPTISSCMMTFRCSCTLDLGSKGSCHIFNRERCRSYLL